MSVFRKYPATFWVANVMEIFERMAWYGFYAVSSLYITDSVTDGGLGLTSEQRGVIQGIIPFLLYLFPVVTGALGDKFGYKRTFFTAYLIMTPAYFFLGEPTGSGASSSCSCWSRSGPRRSSRWSWARSATSRRTRPRPWASASST